MVAILSWPQGVNTHGLEPSVCKSDLYDIPEFDLKFVICV